MTTPSPVPLLSAPLAPLPTRNNILFPRMGPSLAVFITGASARGVALEIERGA